MRARSIRVLLAVVVGTLALAGAPVRSNEPVRSGTITGWGYTWPAMFSGEARNCQWDEWDLEGVRGANPECRVWLDSGCDPDLAGREPAVTASIVEISDLADGTTTRTFEWGTDQLVEGDDHGGVVVQMWTADCREVLEGHWRSVNRSWYGKHFPGTTFRIPRDVTWMTVTTNDTVKVHWTLR